MIRRLTLVALPLAAFVAAASAQAPSTPGVVRTGNISPIIESLDTSLAFYETLLHLQVPPDRGGGPRPFMVNPGLHKMFGTTGATERHVEPLDLESLLPNDLFDQFVSVRAKEGSVRKGRLANRAGA